MFHFIPNSFCATTEAVSGGDGGDSSKAVLTPRQKRPKRGECELWRRRNERLAGERLPP